MNGSPLVIASNRGPVGFVRDESGDVVERRGVGGLVTAVGGAVRGREATWIAAPMTDEDRARIGTPTPVALHDDCTVNVHFADIAPDKYDSYYNEFSNRILWFLHHHLWNLARPPEFGDEQRAHFDAYREVNERFAEILAREATPGAIALPQDYHLSLVPGMVRARRDDLRMAMFWHIPFCPPDQIGVIGDWGPALLEGMLGADVVGFHTEWWAANFAACCNSVLGAKTTEDTVTHLGRTVRVAAYPIGVDIEGITAEAARPEVARAREDIDRIAGDRKLLLRVDRTELSKNILRGLMSYGAMLSRRPDLRGRVTHLVLLTPSRGDVPEYQEYTRACVARADAINARFGTPGWKPVTLEIEDDFARTLAAYQRYDVLLVNPVYDGMNLVAREGPVLNQRDGMLVLSANAGAAAELGEAALIVNPFDTRDTTMAIERALEMEPSERAKRAAELRKLAPGTPPREWLDRQIEDVSRA
jgi:trehalose 6-phosphate synthase